MEERRGFWWGKMRERERVEVSGEDGWITLRWYLQEVGCGGMDCIELAQDRNRWRALVNAVMNLRVP
jgi:hypothetical protein